MEKYNPIGGVDKMMAQQVQGRNILLWGADFAKGRHVAGFVFDQHDHRFRTYISFALNQSHRSLCVRAKCRGNGLGGRVRPYLGDKKGCFRIDVCPEKNQ